MSPMSIHNNTSSSIRNPKSSTLQVSNGSSCVNDSARGDNNRQSNSLTTNNLNEYDKKVHSDNNKILITTSYCKYTNHINIRNTPINILREGCYVV